MEEADRTFRSLHSVEQRQARLTVTGCRAADAERARAIFALAVREQVAGGVEFNEGTAMAAGAPAADAYRRLAIRAWDKQYGIDVPAFAAARLVADGRSLDDEGHGSGGVPAQPFIKQMRIGVIFRAVRNPHEPPVAGEGRGARKAQIGTAFENEIS